MYVMSFWLVVEWHNFLDQYVCLFAGVRLRPRVKRVDLLWIFAEVIDIGCSANYWAKWCHPLLGWYGAKKT